PPATRSQAGGTPSGVPAARDGLVPRAALVDRLMRSSEQVIAVVAPPGYGKTTLLAQWAERLGHPAAWVSCERSDNDPVVLWGNILGALERVVPVDPGAMELLATAGGGVDVVARLVDVLRTTPPPVVLVLDHLEAITSARCRTAIAEFALRVPAGWR